MRKASKGFTLIELLIVISIVAVLSTVVILSLNPAELLRQARDSNRVSDLATLKNAIALYLADVTSPSMGTNNTCYTTVTTGTLSVPSPTGTFVGTETCTNWMVLSTLRSNVTNTVTFRNNNGAGWIPINFGAISSGAPFDQLPSDPVNQKGACSGVYSLISISACGLFYAYEPSGTSYKLSAKMQSSKYIYGGGGDVESRDGGQNDWMYEIGTSLSL